VWDLVENQVVAPLAQAATPDPLEPHFSRAGVE
jgi:hypothetical protein